MLSTEVSSEEAGGHMVLLNFFGGGFLGTADIFCIEAACVKPASLWRIDGTGDIPFENNPFLFHRGVRRWGGGQQGLGIGVQGASIEFVTMGELHDFTQIHDGHPIADVLYYAQVVGYEQVSQIELCLQVLKKVNDLCLDGNIQS
jgi:hypothetical protein